MTRYLIRFEDGTASIVEADRIVSFEERANQYLADRSLHVLYADGEHVAARCQGYSKTYRLGYEAGRGWWCSCRISGECPHLIALKTVVGTSTRAARRSEIEEEARRARDDRVPALEAEVAELRELAEELQTDLATARSAHHLELMERDIELNELRAEVQRLRASRTAARQRGAAEARRPAPGDAPAWIDLAVPEISRRHGEGSNDRAPERSPTPRR